jgi:hypothetical protein
MAEVPENQKVACVPNTRLNDAFAADAATLLPKLAKWSRPPQRLIRFEKDNSKYFGVIPIRDEMTDGFENRPWGRDEEFVLDFGIHMVGYLSFRLEAEGVNIDAPCRLQLTFGESPIDVTEDMTGVKTWISTSWLPNETINIDYMPDDVSLPRRYAFRYLRIHVVDTSPKYKVKFSNVVCHAVSAVDPQTSLQMYDFGDPLLQSLDTNSIFTLRDCMQTVFEDGPRRDRRVWIGDLRLQALANYHTFKDYSLVKRCLLLFAALPREDDTLPACLFEKPALTPASDYIVDYDALFGTIVYDYVIASGDVETGRVLWPTVQGSLKKALAHVDPETHLFDCSRTAAWKFLDWAPNLDHSAGLHGLLIYCLRSANALAEKLSMLPPYTAIVSQMSAAAGAFLDEQTSLFVSGPDRQVSHASAAWLTLSEALPREVSRKALLATLAHPTAVKPLTPYLYHHIVDALVSVGLFSEAIKLLRSYWGGMVEAGADTFWECFDQTNPRASPYGHVLNNSFCHAWSCTPTYFLRAKLVGFLSATALDEIKLQDLDREYVEHTCS